MKRTVRAGPRRKEIFEVEKIIDHKGNGSELEFLVKWKRYGTKDNSWMSETELLDCGDALEEYKKSRRDVFGESRLMALAEQAKKVTAKKEDSTEPEFYEVEDIVSHRMEKGKIWYLVSWKGYPGDDSEVLEDDLQTAPLLLKKYQQREKLGRFAETSTKKASSSIREEAPVEPSSRSTRRSRANEEEGDLSSALKETPRSSRKRDATPADLFDVKAEKPEETPRKRRRDGMELRKKSLSPGKSPIRVLPRRSCNQSNSESDGCKEYGISSGLDVESLSSFRNEGNQFLVKVTYRDPIPAGFQKTEIVPTSVVRKYTPLKLIDLYESLLRV